MSETEIEKNDGVLKLIEVAEEATKGAARSCKGESKTLEYLEMALALLREGWIVEDGQEGRRPVEVAVSVQEVSDLLKLEARGTEQKGGE